MTIVMPIGCWIILVVLGSAFILGYMGTHAMLSKLAVWRNGNSTTWMSRSEETIQIIAVSMGVLTAVFMIVLVVVYYEGVPRQTLIAIALVFAVIGVLAGPLAFFLIESISDARVGRKHPPSASTTTLAQAADEPYRTISITKVHIRRRYLERLFGLDYDRSVWVEEEDLGKERTLHHKNGNYSVKIPQEINRTITLRLEGLGKTRNHKTGDLLLHVWLNKGEDVRKNLWLSESSARMGAKKALFLDGQQIKIVIPPKSHNGLTIRLKGLGRESSFDRRAPALREKKKGNALVKLCVYPDSITPRYESFDALSTENMALEGWVYRKFDEVVSKLGKSSFPDQPVLANEIADLFNERGWTSTFNALVEHLSLTHLIIELTTSAANSLPGSCQKTAIAQNNTQAKYNYRITINEQFLDNPFAIAAIMAHELCHVVLSEKVDSTPPITGYVLKSEKDTLEEERTVDLLVFMFKLGEFQLRVARDKRMTLGYFNQDVFERIQEIVSRKLTSS